MADRDQHILVVDDDPEIRGLVGKVVEGGGYRVALAPDARAARKKVDTTKVDLIVLDLMLPGKDGLTFCKELRAEGIGTPIIMLTAKGDDFDRVLGLELGADDYIAKPFHGRELLARIKAILRRAGSASSAEAQSSPRYLKFEGWTLDTAKRELVSDDDVVVLLSSAEYELLVAFLTWPQAVLSREMLLDATRGRSAIISDRSIDLQVSRLRRKLGDDPKMPRIIKTIWGDGYLFTPDVLR
jgi:two-component system, OmpR family, response regulator